MKNAGFTLMELMLGAVVLAATLGGLIAVFTASLTLVDSGKNLTIAVNHAQCVLEEIRDRNLPFTSATQQDLDDWAQDVADWAERDFADPNSGGGCNSLPNEAVQVAASYPPGGTRPIEFLVTVNWTEKTRARGTQLVTLATER